jgi:hypothetical protein
MPSQGPHGLYAPPGVQCAAPHYRRLAVDERIELTVLFLSMASVEGAVDEDFGKDRSMRDAPLLEGFRSSPFRMGRHVRVCTDSSGS